LGETPGVSGIQNFLVVIVSTVGLLLIMVLSFVLKVGKLLLELVSRRQPMVIYHPFFGVSRKNKGFQALAKTGENRVWERKAPCMNREHIP
jgi:hypothetical protein